MKILILTACTGDKAHAPANCLTQADFQQMGTATFAEREKELAAFRLPAGEMYTGRQHVLLKKGLDLLRRFCPGIQFDLKIVSAGYGLLEEHAPIVPYEMTFSGMKAKDLRKWADFLDLPAKTLSALAGYDTVFFLLGKEYLRAVDLPKQLDFPGNCVFVCGRGGQAHLPEGPRVHCLLLDNKDGRRLGAALVSLKGRVMEILGEEARQQGGAFAADMFRFPERLKDFIRSFEKKQRRVPGPEPKTSLPAKKKSEADALLIAEYDARVIRVPESWKNSPHRKKMRYFIPEWDDLVNPAYDFLTDSHPHGTGDAYEYAHYAHEIYESPPYDGILISKIIVEAKKSKKALLEKIGVHRYLRVPREFPIMGDCGAFGYLTEAEPPYETGEILDYYQRLDFDYGVSIDHLIVNAVMKKEVFFLLTPDREKQEISQKEYEKLLKSGKASEVSSRKFQENLFDATPRVWRTEIADDAEKFRRYEITVNNARSFMEMHRKRGYSFTPIGAAQGWSPESYADAVKEYQKMGYTYIALGGLVRSKTPEILEVLEAVNRVLKPGTDLHLFGVARPEALKEMQDLGVRSLDSASFLRRAWLGANSNYFAPGHKYAAIRIPQPEKSPKAKKIVKAAKASLEEIQALEKKCLELLRAYDRDEADMEDVFDAVMTYDGLIEGRRVGHDRMIRKTLEDRPWKKCECRICREIGAEVIIFRGNNRNRRRGFHNTHFFYQHFCKIFGAE
ncbi:MAG: tRNA-guanine transglycosylase DpdA [Desulfobacterales bacterium]